MSPEWWRGAVIYQIYPRSFQDSNNDGIGDLNGITQRLDYIAGLGVDAIWISPFYPSPMKDFGYDVSEYRDIDPIFGTLHDFDLLVQKAHRLNLKVIIDLVLSHTSDQHPWFQDPAKKDWYVWAEKPNNWVSVFGGSAWTYDKRHGQYYLHNFLKEQPDLNFHNPYVQQEAVDICRFWLERGVDGFRLDVVNFYFHDHLLRDNPIRTDLVPATQFEGDSPYSRQYHLYDKSRPENIAFLRKFRALLDEYPDRFSVGEIGDDDPYARSIEYTTPPDLLHTAYNTSMMIGTHKELTEDVIRVPVETFVNQAFDNTKHAYPSWAFSNHDVVRAASRWYAPFDHTVAFSKMLIALLGCLPGTLFLYQGEELGLPETQIPFDRLQDPWVKQTWPLWQGRDGCRTPMPWTPAKPYAGFSAREPWLPMPEKHFALNVHDQDKNNSSCLNFARRFFAWRRKNTALLYGNCIFQKTENLKILHFVRRHNGHETRCVFNLSADAQTYEGETLEPFTIRIIGF